MIDLIKREGVSGRGGEDLFGEEEYQSLYQSLITIDDRNQSILSLSLSLSSSLTPPLSHTSPQFLHSIGSDNDNRGDIRKGRATD